MPYFLNSALILKPDPYKRQKQVDLILGIAPYYKKAKSLKEEEEFLSRLWTLWFIRWRLKPSDFDGDLELMEYTRNLVKKAIKKDLFWASACSKGDGHDWTWQFYMECCEGGAGIIKRRPNHRKPTIASMSSGGLPPRRPLSRSSKFPFEITQD